MVGTVLDYVGTATVVILVLYATFRLVRACLRCDQ